MRKILEYLEKINDELFDAREYAEIYLQMRVEDKEELAMKFKTMSEEELTHASIMRDLVIQNMKKIKMVYNPPAEFEENLTKSDANFDKKMAQINQLLSM